MSNEWLKVLTEHGRRTSSYFHKNMIHHHHELKIEISPRYETVYEEECTSGSSQQQCTTVNEQVFYTVVHRHRHDHYHHQQKQQQQH